ncbi:hypothetical protein BLNAU_1749 [Blattamonas nauphoetae]|uniref:Uncharacterized protein n=1 Tax=Blattamonas nauphoetae TaxID=2049346 RepID=A0ABQ9YHS8_9EUKA|nr:hypothetical protein BLNAU_1749 [Blattamonas nauphoetae]
MDNSSLPNFPFEELRANVTREEDEIIKMRFEMRDIYQSLPQDALIHYKPVTQLDNSLFGSCTTNESLLCQTPPSFLDLWKDQKNQDYERRIVHKSRFYHAFPPVSSLNLDPPPLVSQSSLLSEEGRTLTRFKQSIPKLAKMTVIPTNYNAGWMQWAQWQDKRKGDFIPVDDEFHLRDVRFDLDNDIIGSPEVGDIVGLPDFSVPQPNKAQKYLAARMAVDLAISSNMIMPLPGRVAHGVVKELMKLADGKNTTQRREALGRLELWLQMFAEDEMQRVMKNSDEKAKESDIINKDLDERVRVKKEREAELKEQQEAEEGEHEFDNHQDSSKTKNSTNPNSTPEPDLDPESYARQRELDIESVLTAEEKTNADLDDQYMNLIQRLHQYSPYFAAEVDKMGGVLIDCYNAVVAVLNEMVVNDNKSEAEEVNGVDKVLTIPFVRNLHYILTHTSPFFYQPIPEQNSTSIWKTQRGLFKLYPNDELLPDKTKVLLHSLPNETETDLRDLLDRTREMIKENDKRRADGRSPVPTSSLAALFLAQFMSIKPFTSFSFPVAQLLVSSLLLSSQLPPLSLNSPDLSSYSNVTVTNPAFDIREAIVISQTQNSLSTLSGIIAGNGRRTSMDVLSGVEGWNYTMKEEIRKKLESEREGEKERREKAREEGEKLTDDVKSAIFSVLTQFVEEHKEEKAVDGLNRFTLGSDKRVGDEEKRRHFFTEAPNTNPPLVLTPASPHTFDTTPTIHCHFSHTFQPSQLASHPLSLLFDVILVEPIEKKNVVVRTIVQTHSDGRDNVEAFSYEIVDGDEQLERLKSWVAHVLDSVLISH